ncbi:DUF1329 domain-containing protein [Alkalilimnicola ehrlichii MLHE-1]|uniref:Outer membrane lipoprotein-sorting protein n=1 Tax=Alkalilimnicola ehrlichii (strain ATCC BAA-1101 / DSM 17681 / MLHE-1) TaxID=187272 RepID=Q0A5T2_ALKEH|nr:DUF1329 domain-containing protein [Alkalilimnicola ehrlichii]ABI57805.1 conserved hypothetical protein [Alkalilimnicola ehrlichii MLHE-1]
MRLTTIGYSALLAGLVGLPTGAWAEIPEGTVLSADNIDELYDQTFQGHRVGDLLTERLEWRIRESGFEMPMYHSQAIELDPSYLEATEGNREAVSFNPDTRQVEGWQAGMPFPEIDEDDPHIAEKLIWNWYYGQPRGDVMNVPNVTYMMVDADSGVDRIQNWWFLRYTMKGRLAADDPVAGDGSELSRTLFVATEPRDVRGLGTLSIRYDSDAMEDVWAYIPAVRRVRRLSGGAWMDPVGSTDQLQDDIEIFNAQPSWYDEYRLVERRWVLAAANGRADNVNGNADDVDAQYPLFDLSQSPYWNVNFDRYEPREVWVIEAIPPSEHPYSRKVVYMDTQYPRLHYGEAYNQAGDFWKFLQFNSTPGEGDDGFRDIRTNAGVVIDFLRNRATIFIPDHSEWSTNTPGFTEDDIGVSTLRSVAR